MDDVSPPLAARFEVVASDAKDVDREDARAERVDMEEEGRDGGLDGALFAGLFAIARYFLIVGVRGATKLDVFMSMLPV